jgi:O-antigen/teichoic acid export membrane protein
VRRANLLKKIDSFLFSTFAKNVGTLTVGTTIAQLITLVTTPVLSRMFTPADYGLAALFSSVTTITATLVALSYPIRIMLPKAKDEAWHLAVFAVFCSITLGVGMLVSTLVLPSSTFVFLGLSSLERWLGVAISVGVLMALINVVNCWFNRNEQFKYMAALKITQSVIVAASGLLMGLMSVNMGLIYAQIIAVVGVFFAFTFFSSIEVKKTTVIELVTAAKKHKSALFHLYPSALLDVVTTQLPVFLITLWFATDMAGQYRMAYSLLALPAGLVGTAISQVFYQRFSTVWPDSKKAQQLLFKTIATLSMLGVVPFAIIFMAGEEIFSFALGEAWAVAGQMSSVLALLAFFSLIHSSTSTTYIVLSMERFFMFLSFPVMLLRVFSLYMGHLNNDLFLGLRLLTFFEITNFFIFQYFVFRKIKKGQ